MAKHSKEAHEFALYYPLLRAHERSFAIGSVFELHDQELVHRITRVLRMGKNDECVLFDDLAHIRISIDSISPKKFINARVLVFDKNKELTPYVTALLPILKRDECEQAIYALAELGVQEIHLVETAKVNRKWGGQKELDRFTRVVISAAEQSKHFSLPIVHPPQPLAQVLAQLDSATTGVFFHPMGMPVSQAIIEMKKSNNDRISVLVGPEGDLTADECREVIDAGFITSKLTPTVLRAYHAMLLGVGIVRSVF